MNILIALPAVIPAQKYGGTERVVWYLGKELIKFGHRVTYLVNKGSYCDFAPVLIFDSSKKLEDQIPGDIDFVHINYDFKEKINLPHLVTMHVNIDETRELDENTVFVSRNHAARFGSTSYVYNGMDWADYGKPDLQATRKYFHFLGNAAWRIKNVRGAINAVLSTQSERLKVLGGRRLNIKMGFRLTLSPRISFYGMVGGDKKHSLLKNSKGLIFPVRWNEPFGLAITESLYFGCPVFGTPYGSLPELVINEVGFLSNSLNSLSAALLESELYSKERCHEYAAENFNSKKMAQEYLQRYERILNGEKLNATAPKLVKRQEERFLPFY